MTNNNSMARALARHIPDIDKAARCPVPDCPHREWAMLFYCIQHLNDRHEWPREKIADWLDTLDLDLEVRQDPVRGPSAPTPGFTPASTSGVSVHEWTSLPASTSEFQLAIALESVPKSLLYWQKEYTDLFPGLQESTLDLDFTIDDGPVEALSELIKSHHPTEGE